MIMSVPPASAGGFFDPPIDAKAALTFKTHPLTLVVLTCEEKIWLDTSFR